MNDTEIKKALESCLIGECEGCPISEFSDCYEKLKDEAMSLINRQQAEIERLKSLCTSKDVIINEQEAKIERLKWEKDHFEFKVDDLNGKLEKFKEYRDIKNGAYEREIERLQTEIKQAKSEAIKEFAEKLINKLDATHDMVNLNQKIVVTDTINMVKRLVKEMVGTGYQHIAMSVIKYALTADVVEVETIKAWLCEMAINNVGCVIDGDFSNACEEITARLDGLRNFAKERSEG